MKEIINYDTLLEKYAGASLQKQYNLLDMIGGYDWQIDMDTKTVSFGDKYEFPMQIIGSYAYDSNTWLWAWANEGSNIPEDLLIDANAMKQLGENQNIDFLLKPEYKIDAIDVHALGVIASGTFNSSAYYTGNYGSGILLMTLKSEDIDNQFFVEQARVMSIIPDMLANLEVNHKRAITHYLKSNNYQIAEEGDVMTGTKNENEIKIEFDHKGRMVSVNGEIKA